MPWYRTLVAWYWGVLIHSAAPSLVHARAQLLYLPSDISADVRRGIYCNLQACMYVYCIYVALLQACLLLQHVYTVRETCITTSYRA